MSILHENYGPGDRTNGEIEAAKALWNEKIPPSLVAFNRKNPPAPVLG
jgi:hypothetical protein